MTLAEIRAACVEAASTGRDTIQFVLPRRSSGGRRMRVMPGVLGEIIWEEADRTVVHAPLVAVCKALAKLDGEGGTK